MEHRLRDVEHVKQRTLVGDDSGGLGNELETQDGRLAARLGQLAQGRDLIARERDAQRQRLLADGHLDFGQGERVHSVGNRHVFRIDCGEFALGHRHERGDDGLRFIGQAAGDLKVERNGLPGVVEFLRHRSGLGGTQFGQHDVEAPDDVVLAFVDRRPVRGDLHGHAVDLARVERGVHLPDGRHLLGSERHGEFRRTGVRRYRNGAVERVVRGRQQHVAGIDRRELLLRHRHDLRLDGQRGVAAAAQHGEFEALFEARVEDAQLPVAFVLHVDYAVILVGNERLQVILRFAGRQCHREQYGG